MIATNEIQSKSTEKRVETVSQELTKPSLDQVLCRIRQDAAKDTLHYLIRSNTGHDGE